MSSDRSNLPRFGGAAIALAAAMVFGSCSSPIPAPDGSFSPTAEGGLPPVLTEASGLAASRRAPGMFWAHNDSGAQPLLHAIDGDGRLRGTIRLGGAKAVDWEDMAAFELDGQAWLLVADVGDNAAGRRDGQLYVIAEPDPANLDPGRELVVPVAVRIPVLFPDGPRDCEAVAVDAGRREILLITKRSVPPAVYRLPLTLEPAAAGGGGPARWLGSLDRLPRPNRLQALTPTPAGRFGSQPTGLDLAADGRTAVVLTYGRPWLYSRKPDETWAEAFHRPPVPLPPHGLAQAEAVAFAPDGRGLLAAGEGDRAPLVGYTRPGAR